MFSCISVFTVTAVLIVISSTTAISTSAALRVAFQARALFFTSTVAIIAATLTSIRHFDEEWNFTIRSSSRFFYSKDP